MKDAYLCYRLSILIILEASARMKKRTTQKFKRVITISNVHNQWKPILRRETNKKTPHDGSLRCRC